MDILKACGYDEVVECPHDKSHQILKSRMHRHLVRCRKNYPNSEKSACPFNSTHLIDKKELNYHLESCPDRASFDLYKYKINPKPDSSSVPYDEIVVPELKNLDSIEDWSDCNTPTYDPEKYCNKAPILRTNVGGTPSEKKAFRQAQREKLAEVKNFKM